MGNFQAEMDDTIWEGKQQYRAFVDLLRRVRYVDEEDAMPLPSKLEEAMQNYQTVNLEPDKTLPLSPLWWCGGNRGQKANAASDFMDALRNTLEWGGIPEKYRADVQRITQIRVKLY